MPEQQAEILKRRRKRAVLIVVAVLILYAIQWAEIFFASATIRRICLPDGQILISVERFGSLLGVTVANGYLALLAGLGASYAGYRIAMAFFASRGVWGVVSLVCGAAALWWTYEATCDHYAEFPLDLKQANMR